MRTNHIADLSAGQKTAHANFPMTSRKLNPVSRVIDYASIRQTIKKIIEKAEVMSLKKSRNCRSTLDMSRLIEVGGIAGLFMLLLLANARSK